MGGGLWGGGPMGMGVHSTRIGGGTAQHGPRGGCGVKRGSLLGRAGVSPQGALALRGRAWPGTGGDPAGGTGRAACVSWPCPGLWPWPRCRRPAQAARIRGMRAVLRDLAGISGAWPWGRQLSRARHGIPVPHGWALAAPWPMGLQGASIPPGTPAARVCARRGSLGRGGGCRWVSPAGGAAGDGGTGGVPAPGGLRGGLTPRRGGAAGACH